MVLANLLLCISMTVFIPSMPHWLLYEEGFSTEETGLAMGVFALGLFLPGAFCSYLVQHFRRNMVCVWAITLLAVSMMAPLYLPIKGMLWVAIALRLVQGMAFGLAQMVLTSTLIIDTCESFQRTEANHSVTWFGRFALSLGPLLGLLLLQQQGFTWVLWASAGCCVLAMLLILSVHFPFRVPTEKIHALSLDRFLLVSGWQLMLHLFLVTLAVGMLLSLRHSAEVAILGVALASLGRRHRPGRLPFPAVLRQAEPSLSARNVAEHLHAGMGKRPRRRHRTGLQSFCRQHAHAYLRGPVHHRAGPVFLRLFHARLVYSP